VSLHPHLHEWWCLLVTLILKVSSSFESVIDFTFNLFFLKLLLPSSFHSSFLIIKMADEGRSLSGWCSFLLIVCPYVGFDETTKSWRRIMVHRPSLPRYDHFTRFTIYDKGFSEKSNYRISIWNLITCTPYDLYNSLEVSTKTYTSLSKYSLFDKSLFSWRHVCSIGMFYWERIISRKKHLFWLKLLDYYTDYTT
jgi:hypothetical protein